MTWRDCKAELGQEAQGKLSAKAETAPKKQGPGHHVLDFAPLHPVPPQHSFPILLEKNTQFTLEGDSPDSSTGINLGEAVHRAALSTPIQCSPQTPVWRGPSHSLSRDWILGKALQRKRKRPEPISS